VAEEITGAARGQLWARLAAVTPALAEFQTRTARQITLFTLTRRNQTVAATRSR